MEIDGSTLIFIIFILYFFFSSPDGDGVSSQYEYNQLQLLKEHLGKEYETFQNMTAYTNFKNITGLKLSYEDQHTLPQLNATYPLADKDYDSWYFNQTYLLMPDEVLSSIKNDVWTSSNVEDADIYPYNITSTLVGQLQLGSNNEYTQIRLPMPRIYDPPNELNHLSPLIGDRYSNTSSSDMSYNELKNVTFQQGDVTIKITHVDKVANRIDSRKTYRFNTQDTNWKLLNLQIEFNDKFEHERHFANTLAIYDIKRGRIVSLSDSAKFHSLFAFPHYMGILKNEDDKTSAEIFNETKQLIEEYWETKKYLDTLTMFHLHAAYDDASEKCEYMTFLQLEPWNQFDRDQLKIIDDELNWPLGRPANISTLPPIKVKNGLMYSPDCGIKLNIRNAKGIRYELKMRTVRNHLLMGLLLLLCQIYLLLRQMQHTNTPSAVNKISYYSLSMINLVDGLLASIYFFSSAIIPELYLPLVVSAFVSFILASIFETRYLISVYASQVNETTISWTSFLQGNEEEERERPVVIPDEASISSSLYGRFFFTLFFFTFLVISSTTWPLQIRKVFEYSMIFILSSYWFPQIFRNALKGIPSKRARLRQRVNVNRRQNKFPLLWTFVLGTTLIRLTPVVYVFTFSANVFRHHKNVHFALLVSLWLLFQICVLYSQDILGSRWFLPDKSIPESYSYFQSITLKFLNEHGDSKSKETYTTDCSICMSEIALYIEDVPQTHAVDKYTYMVTPCNHIFHTECLENWMSYKLQCPVCRAPLHPI